MAVLTIQTITPTGIVPNLSPASAGGDQWNPASTTFLMIVNSGGSTRTVTVITTALSYGQPVENVIVPIAPGTQALLGPYDAGMVASSSTGLASMTYDSPTGLTVAALST